MWLKGKLFVGNHFNLYDPTHHRWEAQANRDPNDMEIILVKVGEVTDANV